MTQLETAKRGAISEEMRICAEQEGVSPEFIRQGVEAGNLVVIRNNTHQDIAPLAVGKGLRTKINANIGTSRDRVDLNLELEKVRISAAAGADTLMDLSTGGDIRAIRKAIKASPLVIGTVPIYQAAAQMLTEKRAIVEMSADDMFRVIEENGEDGVDFITVHCGVTQRSVACIEAEGRLLGIVSRGGSITANWMDCQNRENPLYEYYDRLLEIAKRYDMVLSLGDGLRPGCIADATDRGQVQELIVLGELAKRARDYGDRVMFPSGILRPIFSCRSGCATAPPFMSWGLCRRTLLPVTITSPRPSVGPLPARPARIFSVMSPPPNICGFRRLRM